MSLDLADDKSTLVQVMAWCRQATSHYLSQCWPRSLTPYGVTRSQWVNVFHHHLLAICRGHPKWVGSSLFSMSQDGCPRVFISLIWGTFHQLLNNVLWQRGSFSPNTSSQTCRIVEMMHQAKKHWLTDLKRPGISFNIYIYIYIKTSYWDSHYKEIMGWMEFLLLRWWPHVKIDLLPIIMLPDGGFLFALHFCAIF